MKPLMTILVAAALLAACGEDERPRETASPATKSAAATPAPALGETFRSRRYGYTISYPDQWSALGAKRPLEAGEMLSFNSESADRLAGDPRGVGKPLLTIAAHELGAGEGLDELRDATLRSVEDRMACPPSGQRESTLGGVPAMKLTYAACAGSDVLWTLAVHEGAGYHVVWWGDPGTEKADRDRYEAILATLAFEG